MGFCVEQRASSKRSETIERMDVFLLAAGKRARLSFEEINELRVQDLLDYLEAYSGATADRPRQATQDDIDSFFA